ncbi:hypothetical protein SLEP1_g35670 [Rubroshorea leprosula]|uniref:Disease resistance protein At4g27190-like leucine-rich repeats domain-containing protein n=1 Tax=Rubroshorea leprosula TaxID=152421 RepID=A0AAV5KP90_9ROSI|nr:hypothetical protein SLEP1_g35670 [Rubroshorea leprosula]
MQRAKVHRVDVLSIWEIAQREIQQLSLMIVMHHSILSHATAVQLYKEKYQFPLLEEVMVAQCANFETFCHGVVRTPSLQRIQLTQEDDVGRPAVELNDTINQSYKEKLVEIWNKNPQEILDFKQPCVLEICNRSDLKYLLTPSMALSLVSLTEMKVKNSEMMEQIITEEEATEANEKGIIFPLIETINLKSCPNLTSFCVQVKGAAEGGSAERIGKEAIDIPIAPFFSDQVCFFT